MGGNQRMNKAYKYRLYPNSQQAEDLQHWLDMCRNLYNAMLEQRFVALQRPYGRRKYIRLHGPEGQQPMVAEKAQMLPPEYYAIASNVRQNVAKRVDNSFQRWYKKLARRPRFQSWRRYDSFQFESPTSWELNYDPTRRHSHVRIGRIGWVKIRMDRNIQGEPRTLTIRKRAGRWWAIISCRNVPERELPASNNAVGIDLRVTLSFCTLSTGERIMPPRHLEQSLAKLRRLNKKYHRQQKGSNRREQTVLSLQRAHERVANQRREFHHELAYRIVRDHSLIVVEDISDLFMTEKWRREPYPPLARAALDNAWGQFLSILENKALEAGRIFLKVDPKYSSQICSACGAMPPVHGNKREYHCPVCGNTVPADTNAARNVLQMGYRALESTENVA